MIQFDFQWTRRPLLHYKSDLLTTFARCDSVFAAETKGGKSPNPISAKYRTMVDGIPEGHVNRRPLMFRTIVAERSPPREKFSLRHPFAVIRNLNGLARSPRPFDGYHLCSGIPGVCDQLNNRCNRVRHQLGTSILLPEAFIVKQLCLLMALLVAHSRYPHILNTTTNIHKQACNLHLAIRISPMSISTHCRHSRSLRRAGRRLQPPLHQPASPALAE